MIVSNHGGTGGGHPSQDQGLIKTRREVKNLKEALKKESWENERLRKKNERLEKEVEKLKKELAAKRQPPKWAKPNKSKGKKTIKKGGPKVGHKPHPRTTPQEIDREITLVPKNCPECKSKLLEPSKWHSHTQIDLPLPPKAIVTRFYVGWCYCSNAKKKFQLKVDSQAQSTVSENFKKDVAFDFKRPDSLILFPDLLFLFWV